MTDYLLDTNLFRYLDVPTEAYKTAARDFFVGVQTDVIKGKTTLFLSAEVACELDVQMHTLREKEKRAIRNMLPVLTQVNADLPKALEHDLRKFSNYLRSPKFNDLFKVAGYKMEYLKASDARIMVDAYMSDAVIVTANIKDFIVYSVISEPMEPKLYDFLNKTYVEVSSEAREAIEDDPFYLDIQTKLETLSTYDKPTLSP